MPKLDIPAKIIQPLTLAVFVCIVVLVLFLRVTHRANIKENVPAKPQTLQEFLDTVLPTTPPTTQQLTLTAERLEHAAGEYLDADGNTVSAFVSKPSGSGPFPAIIIVHGGDASSRTTDRLAAGLGEQLATTAQAVTATIDWREEAYSTNTDAVQSLEEIEATVAWLRAIQEVDEQPIVLFGLGSGAHTAIRALIEKRDLDVQGVIDAYGSIAPTDVAGFDVPILILHARQDHVVPIAQSDALAAALPATLVTYTPIEDEAVDHDFFAAPSADGFTTGLTAITDWLTQHILP